MNLGPQQEDPRRVGWLDLVLLRYAIRVNGITEIALTKLDILSGFDQLQLCTAYQIGEELHQTLPMGPGNLGGMRAIYEELPGWRGGFNINSAMD